MLPSHRDHAAPSYRLYWISDDHGGDWNTSDHKHAEGVVEFLVDLANGVAYDNYEIREKAAQLLASGLANESRQAET